MAATEATKCHLRQGAAWITLNRPESRNALSAVLVSELFDHIAAAVADDAVRVIVLTGAPPAFCAGADLKSPPEQIVAGQRSVTYPDVLNALLDSPKPVIAAVNGAAFAGGLGLVGAADLVVIAEEAQCSFSEVRIGVIPAVISVVCLPKLGIHNAMRLFLTGRRFTGAEAVALGLAHRSAPLAALTDAVQEEIEMIRLGGPTAVAECKKLVRLAPQLSRQAGFDVTGEWSARMFGSAEAAEGMAAFREKRQPAWIKADSNRPPGQGGGSAAKEA